MIFSPTRSSGILINNESSIVKKKNFPSENDIAYLAWEFVCGQWYVKSRSFFVAIV